MANGTTTAMYFATLHKESSLLLGDLAHKQGQRAYIGKVSMDQNSPDYYIEESSTAITDAEEFIVALQEKNVMLAHIKRVSNLLLFFICSIPL